MAASVEWLPADRQPLHKLQLRGKVMPVVHDKVAELSNGAHYTYLDTGAPEGVSNYRTVIFIHGTAHNKCTFTLTVDAIDSSHIRLLS